MVSPSGNSRGSDQGAKKSSTTPFKAASLPSLSDIIEREKMLSELDRMLGDVITAVTDKIVRKSEKRNSKGQKTKEATYAEDLFRDLYGVLKKRDGRGYVDFLEEVSSSELNIDKRFIRKLKEEIIEYTKPKVFSLNSKRNKRVRDFVRRL